MAVALYRIDDRLIHGQVVVGWGQPLDIGFIVLVDDNVACCDWEQDLYRMGVPPEMEIIFATVEAAVREHAMYAADSRQGLVVVPDIATMRRFVEGVPSIREVNVGGIHHRADRVQKLRYVFLSPDEERELRRLAERGVRVTAQDVPAARVVPVTELLGATPPEARSA
ncbi:MAG TPA: PTS sugar transporter subunit IIB [Gemmatimonadaceae bacterium]|nr:PTS sugar transporter subunit IIB [Gemmatimonadaceae bacterium]